MTSKFFQIFIGFSVFSIIFYNLVRGLFKSRRDNMNDMKTDIDIAKGNLWLTILTQVNDEIVSRRQPEYMYTTAAVASFGAVTWGVAALTGPNAIQSAAIVAGIGIFVLALTIILKIFIEHSHYEKLRCDQFRIASKVAEYFKIDTKDFPYAYREYNAGNGHLYSVLIVAISAIAAAVFCFIISFHCCPNVDF
jgi:hypothetical protein